MQSIIDYILREEGVNEDMYIRKVIMETKGDPIDEQWLNDEKPVMTKDGRQVIITEIDLKEVPNIIRGKVKMKDKLFEYEWLDDGTCQKALDNLGNPKKVVEADNLVKAM
jgi:hypothetical protein